MEINEIETYYYKDDGRLVIPKTNIIKLFKKFNESDKLIFVHKNEEYKISSFHSWRGIYDELAISIVKNKSEDDSDDDEYEDELYNIKHYKTYRNIKTVGTLVECLEKVNNECFISYKGGLFEMNNESYVHFNFGWHDYGELYITKIEQINNILSLYVSI